MSEAIYVSPLHFGHMALVAKKRNSFNEVEEVDSEDIPIIHNNKRSRNEPSFSLNKFGGEYLFSNKNIPKLIVFTDTYRKFSSTKLADRIGWNDHNSSTTY